MTVRKAILQLTALLTGVTAFALWCFVFLQASEGLLEVVFMDVGQGDAIYIETPRGSQVVIDGGKGTAVMRELSRVMPFWDRSVDLVIATHPDADHIGGLVDVFNALEVSYLMQSGAENDTPTARAFDEAVTNSGAISIPPARGTKITIDENVVLTVLSREVVAASNANEASVVLRLDYGDTSFLFTGDATKENERELLSLYSALDADVLKVGHHGSDTSTSVEFVSAVSPDTAVISVGRDNSYGHPTENVLETLHSQGVEVLRTDELGSIKIESDGRMVQTKSLGILSRLFGI